MARATGHPSRPLTDQQLYEKFADCLEAGGSPIPADVLFERLSAIQSITARELTAPADWDMTDADRAPDRRWVRRWRAPFVRTAARRPDPDAGVARHRAEPWAHGVDRRLPEEAGSRVAGRNRTAAVRQRAAVSPTTT